jgi:uncharacterized membrane protein YesL
MFSFESFVRLNAVLTAIYRVAWLNLLWVAVTTLGLVVVGVGPATYAMAKYLDRWFRLGEAPPVLPTFIGYCRELRWRPVVVGWMLLAALAVIFINLLSVDDGTLRALNIVMLAVVAIIAVYVFFVMAALDVDTLARQVASALLLGLGSFHLTIIGAAVSGGVVYLLFRFAPLLLLMFGVGIPMAAAAVVVRIALRDLRAESSATTTRPVTTSRPTTVEAVR